MKESGKSEYCVRLEMAGQGAGTFISEKVSSASTILAQFFVCHAVRRQGPAESVVEIILQFKFETRTQW